MINPLNSRHLDRLATAIQRSRYLLKPFRENDLAIWKQLAGAHYSWSANPQRVPVNLLLLAYNVFLRLLVSKAPRSMVTALDRNLKPLAADMEAWMDKAAVGMDLAGSFRKVVANALVGMGIGKVAQAHVGDQMILGTIEHIGQPFFECVSRDDWVHDMTAKRYDQVQFAGNRYRVSLDAAKSNPLFDPEAKALLTAQSRYAYNEYGEPRVTTLSQSTQYLYDAEVEDHCELWDIWLPREKLVLVMPYQESVEGGFANVKPLQVIDWKEPVNGPYHILTYTDLDSNVNPVAPLSSVMDLGDAANQLWRKLIRQGERQKTLVAFMGTAGDDQERINRASDGEAVRVDFPDRIKEVSFGGMNQENLLAVEQVRNIFNWIVGNLDTLAGLSPQSGTLGQDTMLHGSASAQVAEMQDRTVNYAQAVWRDLAYWWYQNPHLTYEAAREDDVPVSITPQMRQTVPFSKLAVSIDPYSMQHQTPQTLLAALKETLAQVILPALPQIMQQGGKLQWQVVLEQFAKLGNQPQLAELIQWGPPPEMQGPMAIAQQAGDTPPMPANTNRTYTRRNVPQQTNLGHSQVMQQALAGAAQPKQLAGIGRMG